MKSTNLKKKLIEINYSLIPKALTVQRVERILSGKIKPELDNIVWTGIFELKRIVSTEDNLILALREHIEKIKKYN